VAAVRNIVAAEGQHTVAAGRHTVVMGRHTVVVGIGCGGSSMRILVDDASEHILHPLHRVLKYGCRVLRFDYNGGWWRCTEGRGNGEDGRDAGLCNSAD
jgi:hypothetical protein